MLIFYLAELKLPNEQQLVFKDIYDSLYEYVCATIMKITNDRAVALDLAQDVFVKYIESFDIFPPIPESKAWLGVVARNTAINYNNKRSSHKETDIDELLNTTIFSYDDVADITANKDSIEYIFGKISSLDRKYADVLMLSLKYEYTPEQISKTLGLNVKTVYTRLARGKSILRELLTEKGVGENVR